MHANPHVGKAKSKSHQKGCKKHQDPNPKDLECVDGISLARELNGQ